MNRLLEQIHQSLIAKKESSPELPFEELSLQCLQEFKDEILEAMPNFFPWVFAHPNLPKQLYPRATFSDFPITILGDEKMDFASTYTFGEKAIQPSMTTGFAEPSWWSMEKACRPPMTSTRKE